MGNSEQQKKRAGQWKKNKPPEVLFKLVGDQERRFQRPYAPRYHSSRYSPRRSPPRQENPLPAADAAFMSDYYRKEFERSQQHVKILEKTIKEFEEQNNTLKVEAARLQLIADRKVAVGSEALAKVLKAQIDEHVEKTIQAAVKSEQIAKALSDLK